MEAAERRFRLVVGGVTLYAAQQALEAGDEKWSGELFHQATDLTRPLFESGQVMLAHRLSTEDGTVTIYRRSNK